CSEAQKPLAPPEPANSQTQPYSAPDPPLAGLERYTELRLTEMAQSIEMFARCNLRMARDLHSAACVPNQNHDETRIRHDAHHRSTRDHSELNAHRQSFNFQPGLRIPLKLAMTQAA